LSPRAAERGVHAALHKRDGENAGFGCEVGNSGFDLALAAPENSPKI